MTGTASHGRRYEVRSTGWPKADESVVIGWAWSIDGAERLAAAARKAPGCTRTEIFDLRDGKVVISRYSGILR